MRELAPPYPYAVCQIKSELLRLDQSRIIPEYIFPFDFLFRIPLRPFASLRVLCVEVLPQSNITTVRMPSPRASEAKPSLI